MNVTEVILERFCYGPMGTFGRLYAKGTGFKCYTVEKPWEGNVPFESCIPEGRYRLKLGQYNRGGYPAFEVSVVPGRTDIKIHKGNTMDDVVGCIAPGMGLGWVAGKWAVTSSKTAFDTFMKYMGETEDVLLTVRRESEVKRVQTSPKRPLED